MGDVAQTEYGILVAKFLLTEIAHMYSAVFLMEEHEEVTRIADEFYEAEQDINDEDNEDKIGFDNVCQLIVKAVEKHVVALLMSRLQQGMGELQLLSKPLEEEMSVTNKISSSSTSVSATSSEHLEALAATSGKHLEDSDATISQHSEESVANSPALNKRAKKRKHSYRRVKRSYWTSAKSMQR